MAAPIAGRQDRVQRGRTASESSPSAGGASKDKNMAMLFILMRPVTWLRQTRPRIGLWLVYALLCVGAGTNAQPVVAQKLHIVGSLAGLHQYVEHEEPFWTQTLPRLSGGRYSADIVPFDRAGVPAQDMLRLMQIGVIPFGTAQISRFTAQDIVLSAVDLAGLNPDIATLRKAVAAYRPFLENALRQRYHIELLGIYIYPAQMIFCAKPFASLSDLAGRRIRVSGASAADLVDALGATPVLTSLSEMVPNIRSGNVSCAITGSMSGNTVGLHEVTTHLHAMPVTWGMALMGANSDSWYALDPPLRVLLRNELPKLEADIWAANEHETKLGIDCNIGTSTCVGGRKGKMTLVPLSPADELRRKDILKATVLPRWLHRCGPQCAAIWDQTIGPALGIVAPPPS